MRSQTSHVDLRETSQASAAQSCITLAIDIGASGVKAMLLDQLGECMVPPQKRPRMPTPTPATPRAVLDVVEALVKPFTQFDRVSVGFPGVVRNGIILSAPNFEEEWTGFHIAQAFERLLRKPVRAANDADVQGFGAISGVGVELVLTLGTGVGTSLFVNGTLVPNLEFGNPKLRNRSLKKIGKKRWNKRVVKEVAKLDAIFHYDRLHIGGGNARRVNISLLPANATIISNLNGLIGGIALWQGVPGDADRDSRLRTTKNRLAVG
jgi:polyphosphate glucokinase